jgi:hypothetical protein
MASMFCLLPFSGTAAALVVLSRTSPLLYFSALSVELRFALGDWELFLAMMLLRVEVLTSRP